MKLSPYWQSIQDPDILIQKMNEAEDLLSLYLADTEAQYKLRLENNPNPPKSLLNRLLLWWNLVLLGD